MTTSEPQELIRVLTQMEYWRQEPPTERQRAFRRFTVRGDATVEQVDDQSIVHLTAKPVMLRDISRGGVGFVVDQFLEPGSVWRLAIFDRGRKAGTQTLVVRYCRLVQDGLYLVGAQFIIEPHLMLTLGVEERALADDIHQRVKPEDTADFLAPDAVDERDESAA